MLRQNNFEWLHHFDKWQKVRHALEGDLIRYLRNAGKNEPDRYPTQHSDRKNTRTALSATISPKRTLAGMTGSVMRKDPEQIIPPELEYLLHNADGSGVGLWQHAQDTLMEINSIGRGGLLVDARKQPQQRRQSRTRIIKPGNRILYRGEHYQLETCPHRFSEPRDDGCIA